MSVEIETLRGAAALDIIDAVSRLRIDVFAAWPYLYSGNAAYERSYLAEFASADDAVVVVARDTALPSADAIVGAATAAPLMSHTSEFAPLFADKGYAPERVFYFGESVLRESHRGRGIGHAFFDHREAAAAAARTPSGDPFSLTAFCAVIRDPDDPRRPAGYRPLDSFWVKRGYMPKPYMIGSYDWEEPDSEGEIPHSMQFWVRPL